MASVLDLVKHYQHNIEKYPDDEPKILKAIDKLFQLDVKVQHLQETGVGRTVNALRKEDGDVGRAARALVYKWKLMVAAEESDQEGDHDNSLENGHGSGKDSDDGQHSRSRPPDQQMNGDHSGAKRRYHSSEDEEPNKKKTRHSGSSESDDYRNKRVKEEPQSNSEDSDSHSESDEESEISETEKMPVKIKTEPVDKDTSKHSSSKHNIKTESSSSKRSQEPDQQQDSRHSKHSERHSVESSSKSNASEKKSRDKEESSDKKHRDHKTEKEKAHKEKEERRQKEKEEKARKEEKSRKEKEEKSRKEKEASQSSSKHSSEKHRSSSSQKDSSSDKNKSVEKSKSDHEKNKSEKHSSSKNEKEKQKSSKEVSDKHKSQGNSGSTKNKSSSKEKSKDSSKETEKSSSHSSKSGHKHSSSKSRSESKTKSSDETPSEKKSSHKSSSSDKTKSSSSKSKEDKPKKKVTVQETNEDSDDGIGCESGASFAEALGMIVPTKSKKKQSTTPIKDFGSPINPVTGDLSPASLLAPTAKLAPLPALEISALPEISPNYKPRPPPKFQPHFNEEDSMSMTISSKNARTKVFSGTKTFGKIPSLYEMCVYVLQEHIDALEYTGGVPYEILKPVVDKATPQQLFMLEHYNPYLMEDTDHLWQKFCEKHFRSKKRQELESWREMYMRCQEEQEEKLKSLTANIRMTQEAKKAPIKQTKMAYVDSVVKPPRNIARKQAQHGTAHLAAASPAARVAALAAAPNVLRTGARAPPGPVALSSSGFNKPKKAPLMAKALQFMRGRKR